MEHQYSASTMEQDSRFGHPPPPPPPTPYTFCTNASIYKYLWIYVFLSIALLQIITEGQDSKQKSIFFYFQPHFCWFT